MRKEIQYGYAITDSSGMLANFVDGDEIRFYRIKREASRQNANEIKKYGYQIHRIKIETI